MKKNIRYIVLSPDSVPINTKSYPSVDDAAEGLVEWTMKFQEKGYYAGVSGHYSLEELLNYCEIIET